uniref:Endoribonuclease L-PSP/chorismate mutase-like domain-containing protein n=1 Tax=Corethron hystrix TaxID=216773 RepID=A0A7S1FSS8_9STRA|mmetsp:Transcript_24799/g.57109  ORF Transcript_24799/g.57109 Transcript_24799/m.57109 type:complete len:162 (+) Transcript_24799:412-897(+)
MICGPSHSSPEFPKFDPRPHPSQASYASVCLTGDLLFMSGHLPLTADGNLLTGAVGPGGKSVDEAYVAAKNVGLNILATLKNELGDLDRVDQIVKLFGIVNSHTDFKEQHRVLDGCSDLMAEVFGTPAGIHARSAIGTNTLPLDITVEVEAIVRVRPAALG